MRIAECMTREPIAISPAESCERALALMDAAGIHHLPVVDRGRIVGIVTPGDVRRRAPHVAPNGGTAAAATDGLLAHVTVGGVMTYAPAVAPPSMQVAEAAALMRARGVRALPVVEGVRLIGILTAGDLEALEGRPAGPRRAAGLAGA
jgi:acetoin utilization protein AcuB